METLEILLFILIIFLIQVAILRWIFRIDRIVELLKYIHDKQETLVDQNEKLIDQNEEALTILEQINKELNQE